LISIDRVLDIHSEYPAVQHINTFQRYHQNKSDPIGRPQLVKKEGKHAGED